MMLPARSKCPVALCPASFALCLLANPVAAHLGHDVLRAERYLKLDAEPRGVRVVVSLTLGPGETVRIAQAADGDRNGEVSSAEADAYMAEWGAGLREDLPIEVDGQPVEVHWGEAYFDPIGPIQNVPGAVEMIARVPLDGGQHTVTIRDRMRVEAFDRTDVKFEHQPHATLVASGPGDAPTTLVRTVAYGVRNVPSGLSVVVEVEGASRGQRAYIFLAVGGFATVLFGLGLWRRRAKPER